ncbi:hypothetical protein CHU32_07300 [Superficieibacter electus]|uniref:Uncharacterized protein n=1 Tax=Superficieibacter electus TaxID=2022662 RepID=A0A2P5GSD2_9ENTR|nr:hypothetical protein CHU33_04345 [Superficieibacter electus]POP49454.1 hypothetical protein CHU32_07300 [Superficieibacter electus]
MRMSVPWQKSVKRIIPSEAGRAKLRCHIVFTRSSHDYLFHKSVINLTHNDVAIHNDDKQGKKWRDVFWSWKMKLQSVKWCALFSNKTAFSL